MVESIGERLRELRNLKDYRQEEVARMLGVERHALSQYETGARIPPSDIVAKLASIYEVSTDYLLGVDITEKEKSVSIDVTGLSHREITLLTCLVEVMKEKGGS